MKEWEGHFFPLVNLFSGQTYELLQFPHSSPYALFLEIGKTWPLVALYMTSLQYVTLWSFLLAWWVDDFCCSRQEGPLLAPHEKQSWWQVFAILFDIVCLDLSSMRINAPCRSIYFKEKSPGICLLCYFYCSIWIYCLFVNKDSFYLCHSLLLGPSTQTNTETGRLGRRKLWVWIDRPSTSLCLFLQSTEKQGFCVINELSCCWMSLFISAYLALGLWINKVRGSLSEWATLHSSSSVSKAVIDMVNASATGGHC